MKGVEVTLPEMLACREERVKREEDFLQRCGNPIISFSMNIPGPIKTNPSIHRAFESGRQMLLESLAAHQLVVADSLQVHAVTGDECILSVCGDPESIKSLTMQVEENHPLGRLFDMDVLDRNGQKLSRPTFRKCLLCQHQAQDCARSRRHSVPEMQDAVEKLLQDYFSR